jgi:anti-anti-sigma factor
MTADITPTPILDASLDQGVLVLTILRKQIEGEEIAAGLKDELLAAVDRHLARWVVLDLRNTRYLSSIAFWPLLRLRQQLADQDGRLIICGLTGAVHDVFTMTKMVSSGGSFAAPFEMAVDRESAIARLLALPGSPAGPS